MLSPSKRRCSHDMGSVGCSTSRLRTSAGHGVLGGRQPGARSVNSLVSCIRWYETRLHRQSTWDCAYLAQPRRGPTGISTGRQAEASWSQATVAVCQSHDCAAAGTNHGRATSMAGTGTWLLLCCSLCRTTWREADVGVPVSKQLDLFVGDCQEEPTKRNDTGGSSTCNSAERNLGPCLAPGDCDKPRCVYREPGFGRVGSALCRTHLIEAWQRIRSAGEALKEQEPKATIPRTPDVSDIL